MPDRLGGSRSVEGAAAEHPLLRRITATALVLAMVTVALVPHLPSLMHMIIIPDFTMMWTGGRFAIESPAQLYDADAVTAAQAWIRDPNRGPLPFIYPPSSLLLLAPFGLLPFWPAFLLWTVGGAAAFWSAGRRLTSGAIAALALLSPAAVTVLMLGQTTLIVGAAVLWSIALLRDRPVLAGVAMGIAAAIKPQCAILAPVAFVADRKWTALFAAGVTWAAIVLASLGFGPGLWVDWIKALPGFPAMIAGWNLDRLGATPSMLARYLGLNPAPFLIAGVIAGVVLVWFGAKADDVKTRALAFVGGTLLASPYAMNYELAVMAPMLVAAMLTTSLRGLVIAAPLFALRVYAIPAAILASLIVALRSDARRSAR